MTTRPRTTIAAAAAALALTAGSIAAYAHTPAGGASCAGIHAAMTNAPDDFTSTIRLYIDGEQVSSYTAQGNYSLTARVPQDYDEHTYRWVVDAGQFSDHGSGSFGPCKEKPTEPPTTAPPTTHTPEPTPTPTEPEETPSPTPTPTVPPATTPTPTTPADSPTPATPSGTPTPSQPTTSTPSAPPSSTPGAPSAPPSNPQKPAQPAEPDNPSKQRGPGEPCRTGEVRIHGYCYYEQNEGM